jgi:5-deoxy-glucuronate isomerase
MMAPRVLYDPDASCRVDVTAASAGWRHLGFRVEAHRIGGRVRWETESEEWCLVFLAGGATGRIGNLEVTIPVRASVFAERPSGLYVPPGHRIELDLTTDAEIAVGRAPAEGRLPPRLIAGDDVRVEMRGGHNVTRRIHHILDPGDAEKLLCVEVYTPSGNWSSYPPHRHDVQDPPHEVELDEVYHYRFDPSDGWALQRLYTGDGRIDEVVVARHGDTILVREGYHPVVTAPGYDCYYLNFLAGPTPSWVAPDDPGLAWVRGNWSGRPGGLRLAHTP